MSPRKSQPLEVLSFIVDATHSIRKDKGGYVSSADLMATAIDAVKTLAQLRPVIVGGFAVSYHAEPRATRDFDLALPPEHYTLASESLLRAGFEGGERTSFHDLTIYHFEKNGIQVDLLEFLDRGFQNQIVSRSSEKEFFDTHVQMISVEDLILTKLLSTRRKDAQDIESLKNESESSGETLDLGYIQTWASNLGISDRLKEHGLT
jgi:predicted nucleotidyltransferase